MLSGSNDYITCRILSICVFGLASAFVRLQHDIRHLVGLTVTTDATSEPRKGPEGHQGLHDANRPQPPQTKRLYYGMSGWGQNCSYGTTLG